MIVLSRRQHRAGRLRLLLLLIFSFGLRASEQTLLTGAGASFPTAIYTKWFAAYQSVGNAQINYQANGSGGGIRAVTEGTVDFGASDMPLTNAQLKKFRDKHGYDLKLFPTVVGAVVATYNIPGLKANLTFTPEILAGIYLGRIKTWNDGRIARANPSVKLPAAGIIPIHRSDGSGTTYCFTDYLSKVSTEWKNTIGKSTSVDWPNGLGGKGNNGVAGLIRHQDGAIGYVELIYAVKNNLPYANVINKSGVAVKANLPTITAAASSIESIPDDFRISITDPPAKDAYPISTYTWLLVPAKNADRQKQHTMAAFLKWALTKGQDMVEGLEYAKLPAAVIAKEQVAIGRLN